MKVRTLASLLGTVLATTLVFTPLVFAYHPHYEDGYSDYEYGNEWDHGWDVDRDYSYGSYRDYGYSRPPYYGGYRHDDYDDRYDDYDDYYGYEHPSGLFGYWGQDAEHHRRGHRHHHLL
jgi:hypothetical protein